MRTVELDTGERHASWLELFFDLVFVVAIAQLSHLFVRHPDWRGALIAGGLFLPVFLAWQGFFAYFERLTDQRLPRSAVPVVTYAYAHLPLVAALMYVASGASLLIRSEGGAAGAWALCAGVVCFLVAVSVAHSQLVVAPAPFVLRARGLAALAAFGIPLVARRPATVSVATLGVLVTLVVFEALTCTPPEERLAKRSSRHG